MSIAILVPTRGRPDKFRNMVQSVAKTTSTKITIYVLLQSEEDVASYDIKGLQIPSNGNLDIKINAFHLFEVDAPTVHLWNRLAGIAYDDKEVTNNIFMLGSDDIVFDTKGWDVGLIKRYDELANKIHVFSLKDYRQHSSNETLSTPHPIVTREYMKAMGYFIPPLFLHWHVDMWTVEIARANNVFTHVENFICVHDKVELIEDKDDTHERLRKRGWRERDAYVDKTSQHILEAEKKRLGACLQ